MADQHAGDTYSINEIRSYVKIRYTCRAGDGPILKGADGPETMDFVTGFKHVIPGLERRLTGCKVGDRLAFTVPAEEAFGEQRAELIIEKPKSDFHFPPGVEPYAGMELPIITNMEQAPDTVHIREVRDDTIVIDLNHPMAGVALRYDLEIVEARPATDKDICGEWEEQSAENACGHAVPEIVLGGEEPQTN